MSKSKKINEKILKFREALGLKPSEFADALGVNRSTMSTYENNGASPGNDFFTKLKFVFPQTCMDYFFSDDAPMFIGESGEKLPEKLIQQNKLIQENKLVQKNIEIVDVDGDTNFWRKLYMEQSEQVKKLTDFLIAKPNLSPLGGLSAN